MARRWIVIGLAAFAALVLVNILVLVFWFPHLMKTSGQTSSTAAVPATSQPNGTVQNSAASATSTEPVKPTTNVAQDLNAKAQASAPPLANSTPIAGKAHTLPSPPPLTGGFVLERQTLSPSGNLRIKYLRDRKAKLRRIALEDVHHPGPSEVLCEYKRSAWVLVSPNDEWIALDERSDPQGGGVRLYRRHGADGVHYEAAENAVNAPPLQDSVWHAYLDATQNDPNTPREGVTIDATNWGSDSQKLGLSVAFVRSVGQTDVPEPWSCTYDVVSNQVEPSASAEGSDNVAPEDSTASPAPNDAADQNAIPQNEIPQGENAENASTDANEMDTQFPGEKFPATRQDALTVPDVNESSLSEISYAINEMYARHGLEFHDAKVAKEFAQFSWYQPRTGVSRDQIESEFSDVEKQNLKVLARCRDAKVAATHRHRQSNRGQPAQEESLGNRFLRDVIQGVSDGLQNQ